MTSWIRRDLKISVGMRYRRREPGTPIWEVYGIFDVKIAPPHVMLFKVSDSTQRKTLSEFTLEQSGLYYRIPEDHRIGERAE